MWLYELRVCGTEIYLERKTDGRDGLGKVGLGSCLPCLDCIGSTCV